MTDPRLYTDLSWIWLFLSPAEEYEEEAALYHRLIEGAGMPDGSTLLHLGSGGGSLDFQLKSHYRITGLDRSPQMLAIARQVNPDIEYLEGDLRTADLGRHFDIVFLHDACSYLTTIDEVRAAYETAARHLRPSGLFITLPEELRSRFTQYETETDTHEIDGRSVTTIIIDYDPDPTDTWMESTYIYVIRENGQQRIESEVHRVALFHLEEWLGAMRAAGFVPEVHPLDLPSTPAAAGYVVVTAFPEPPADARA